MSKRPMDYVGIAPVWHTVIYPDGTTYEGLMKRDLCELRGVMVYGDTGERYAGQWRENNMEGLGERDYNNGVVYRGQFHQAQEHGCGVKVIYEEEAEGGMIIQAGEFSQGVFLGPTVYCDVLEAVETAAEATMEAERAKLFMMKPDGALVNKEKHVRDSSGKLLVSAEEWDTLVQDPLYYPPGTEYMMPGPKGDLYNIPQGEDAGQGRASEENRKLRLKYGEMLAGWISNFYKYAPDDEIEATEAQKEVVEYHREKARKFLVTRDELGLGDVAEEQGDGSDSSAASASSKDPSEIGRIVIERRKDDDEFEDDDDEFEDDDEDFEDEDDDQGRKGGRGDGDLADDDDDDDNSGAGGAGKKSSSNVASKAASVSMALQPLAATTLPPLMRPLTHLFPGKKAAREEAFIQQQQQPADSMAAMATPASSLSSSRSPSPPRFLRDSIDEYASGNSGAFVLRMRSAPVQSLHLRDTRNRESQTLKKADRRDTRSRHCTRRICVWKR